MCVCVLVFVFFVCVLHLLLLLGTELEMLAACKRGLMDLRALTALETNDNLLGHLNLLLEHRLGLTTETGLLSVVTTLTLHVQRSLTLLVLGAHVRSVLVATRTVSVLLLWVVDLRKKNKKRKRKRKRKKKSEKKIQEGRKRDMKKHW
jgi:hypothetical protein